jgi:hypothetical protein
MDYTAQIYSEDDLLSFAQFTRQHPDKSLYQILRAWRMFSLHEDFKIIQASSSEPSPQEYKTILTHLLLSGGGEYGYFRNGTIHKVSEIKYWSYSQVKKVLMEEFPNWRSDK